VKEKQELMKPGKEACERLQLDSDDVFNESYLPKKKLK
jgi:hypothetical protein